MADVARFGGVLGLMALAGMARAQVQTQVDGQAATPAAAAPAGAAMQPSSQAGGTQGVTTLGEVRAVIDEGEPVDLYKYRNPYAPAPNRFDKGYKPPPSPEQVSQGGGYVMYGLYGLIGLAAKGLQSLPGVKGPIQSAVARPPPQLSDDQLRRAAACTDGSGCAAASDMAGK